MMLREWGETLITELYQIEKRRLLCFAETKQSKYLLRFLRDVVRIVLNLAWFACVCQFHRGLVLVTITSPLLVLSSCPLELGQVVKVGSSKSIVWVLSIEARFLRVVVVGSPYQSIVSFQFIVCVFILCFVLQF